MADAARALISDRDADPHEWVADALRRHFDDILQKASASIDPGEIRDVHRFRVALRRLLSLAGDANEIFEVARLKRLRKALKKLSRLAGRVRDQDVYVEALEKLNESAENSQYSSTVLKLIADSRSVRQQAHRKLARTISKESFKDLEEQFHSAVKAVLGQPGLFRPVNVQAAGHQVISARLQDLLDLAGDIYDPFNGDGLHEIRIAAKRLRYALEVFAPVFGDEAQVLADEVARMQTFLGDLHNYDLWISGLRRRLRAPETNHVLDSSDREGAAWILSEFVKERTNSYRSALDLWTAWERTGFEKRFETLISQ